jgi:hypothetical protein
MARYSALLGRRVEVQYRAGDIFLPATGTLVADSGRSIFLEEHTSARQREHTKHFRWEIPYMCIIRITEKPAPPLEGEPKPAQREKEATAQEPAVALFSLRERPEQA